MRAVAKEACSEAVVSAHLSKESRTDKNLAQISTT